MGLHIPAEVLIGGSEDEDVDLSSEPQYNYSKFPLQEMWERGYFADFTGGIKQVKEYAEDLVRKFMRRELGDRVRPALLRARLHQGGSRVMDEYALLIWRKSFSRTTSTTRRGRARKNMRPIRVHEMR